MESFEDNPWADVAVAAPPTTAQHAHADGAFIGQQAHADDAPATAAHADGAPADDVPATDAPADDTETDEMLAKDDDAAPVDDGGHAEADVPAHEHDAGIVSAPPAAQEEPPVVAGDEAHHTPVQEVSPVGEAAATLTEASVVLDETAHYDGAPDEPAAAVHDDAAQDETAAPDEPAAAVHDNAVPDEPTH